MIESGDDREGNEGGDDPRDEEAVTGGRSCGMFVGFFGGASDDDGVGIVYGGGKVGGKEGTADGEVNRGGLLNHGRGEEEVDFGLGGERRMEIGGDGGIE